MALKVEGPFFSYALRKMIGSCPEDHTQLPPKPCTPLLTRLKTPSRSLHLYSVQRELSYRHHVIRKVGETGWGQARPALDEKQKQCLSPGTQHPTWTGMRGSWSSTSMSTSSPGLSKLTSSVRESRYVGIV